MTDVADQATTEITSVCFTEEMKGHISFGESDYDRGAREGRKQNNYLMFHLTICTGDVKRFVEEPEHLGTAEGYVQCDALGGKLPVERGIFNLFIADDEPDTKYMRYRLFFKDGAGHPLTLNGFKVIKDDPGFDAWSDTTTLFTRIYQGHVEAGQEEAAELVGSGIIIIHLLDFAKQLTTFSASGPSLGARVSGLGSFSKLFLGKLWDTYAQLIPGLFDGK